MDAASTSSDDTTATAAATNVSFIGLGKMGWPMASNLAQAGFVLTVHDVSREVVEHFAAEYGARAAAGPDDLAAADVIVTMLPTGVDVANALLDGDGAIGTALRPGTVVVDMSSADPVGTRVLGKRLAQCGVSLVDAPVSGGVPRAEAGTLAIMIGGAPEAVAAVKPVLAALGDRHFEVGTLGCGHAMKALNNFVAGTAFVAATEAVQVGERFGLDPNLMMDVMNVSTARCFNTELVIKQHVISGEFASGFALGLLTKDVGIAAGLAAAIGVPSPLSQEITDRLAEARDIVGAFEDHTRAAELWASRIASQSESH
jgi:3-hydroxyisobutyrate dehydrogenase